MNHWKSLIIFVQRKSRAPMLEPTFWFYLVGAIILAGGSGIWIALAHELKSDTDWDWQPINAALYTYFPALAAGSAFDILLFHRERYIRALAFFSVILIASLVAITTTMTTSWSGCILSFAGCVIAIALWWLANGENTNLREDSDPLTAVGEGNSQKIVGTLSGMES